MDLAKFRWKLCSKWVTTDQYITTFWKSWWENSFTVRLYQYIMILFMYILHVSISSLVIGGGVPNQISGDSDTKFLSICNYLYYNVPYFYNFTKNSYLCYDILLLLPGFPPLWYYHLQLSHATYGYTGSSNSPSIGQVATYFTSLFWSFLIYSL